MRFILNEFFGVTDHFAAKLEAWDQYEPSICPATVPALQRSSSARPVFAVLVSAHAMRKRSSFCPVGHD